jgi:hypothetical protein
MSDANHTPGPWKFWPTHWAGGSDSHKIDGKNTIWIETEKGDEIARVVPERIYTNPTVMANARLIAAAPELFDALELALEIIEATGPGSYPVAEEQIRAAIAKAKGGQS